MDKRCIEDDFMYVSAAVIADVCIVVCSVNILCGIRGNGFINLTFVCSVGSLRDDGVQTNHSTFPVQSRARC